MISKQRNTKKNLSSSTFSHPHQRRHPTTFLYFNYHINHFCVPAPLQKLRQDLLQRLQRQHHVPAEFIETCTRVRRVLRVPGRSLHVCTLTSHDRLSIGSTWPIYPRTRTGKQWKKESILRIYSLFLSLSHAYTRKHVRCFRCPRRSLPSSTPLIFDSAHEVCCSKRCRPANLHRLESNSFHRNIIVRHFVKDSGNIRRREGWPAAILSRDESLQTFRRDGKSVCILYFDEVILGIFGWVVCFFVTAVCILMYRGECDWDERKRFGK